MIEYQEKRPTEREIILCITAVANLKDVTEKYRLINELNVILTRCNNPIIFTTNA